MPAPPPPPPHPPTQPERAASPAAPIKLDRKSKELAKVLLSSCVNTDFIELWVSGSRNNHGTGPALEDVITGIKADGYELPEKNTVRKYLTGEAPTRSEFTGWSDYTKSKGFLTVIEKGLYHKETGGLEDAAKKPDSECTLQQIAVKAWFNLCGGDKDTLEVDNDMVDLTDSIGDKIKQSRQAAEERRLAGTAEGEDQQRRGQEVRDLASGAVSEHKEEVEFQILDITLRHDLVNLVLNAKEYTDDEFRKIRWPQDEFGKYMSREDIAKNFSSQDDDADSWISEHIPIAFPSKEWMSNMTTTYGKSVFTFLKVREHMENNVDPGAPGDEVLSEEEEIKMALPNIICLHSAKHQLGNRFPGTDGSDFDNPDDYYLAPDLAEGNQYLKLKGIFGMNKRELEREISMTAGQLRKLGAKIKRSRPGSTGSSSGNLGGDGSLALLAAAQTESAAARMEEAKVAKVREENSHQLSVERFQHERQRDAVKDEQVKEDQRIASRRLDIQQRSLENQHEQSMSMQKQMMDMQKQAMDQAAKAQENMLEVLKMLAKK